MKHYFIVRLNKGNIYDTLYEMWSDKETALEFRDCFRKQYKTGVLLLEVI